MTQEQIELEEEIEKARKGKKWELACYLIHKLGVLIRKEKRNVSSDR